MGKSTIDGSFSIAMLNYQRVYPINIPLNPIKPPFSYGFPPVSLPEGMFFIVEGTSTEKEQPHGLVFSPFKIGHSEASSLTSLNSLAIFTKQIVSKLYWWIVLIINYVIITYSWPTHRFFFFLRSKTILTSSSDRRENPNDNTEKNPGTLLNAPEFTQIVGPEKC